MLIDATPPACPSCAAADYLRGTVDLTADPDTSGSGIQSVSFEYTDAGGSTWTPIGTDTTGPGPYTTSWDTTLVPDGHYDLRIQITDNADNVTTATLPDKVVDNTAPDVALVGAPTEGQIVSGSISMAASASDVTSPIASVKFYVRGALLATDSSAPFSQTGIRRPAPTAGRRSRSSSRTWPGTPRRPPCVTSASTTSPRHRRSPIRLEPQRHDLADGVLRSGHDTGRLRAAAGEAAARGSRSQAIRRRRGARHSTRLRSPTASTTSVRSPPTARGTRARARSAPTSESTTRPRQAR